MLAQVKFLTQMAAIVPHVDFNLSNSVWENKMRAFDKSWDHRIQSVVKESNKKYQYAVLTEEISATSKASAHRNPEVSKYRAHKEWGVGVKIVIEDGAREVVQLWRDRSTVLREILEARHNAVKSAWSYQRALVKHVLESDRCSAAFDEKDKLAIPALQKDQSQALDAVEKSLNKALTLLKASSEAVDASRHLINQTNAVFGQPRDEILNDIEKARDGVFEAVRKFHDAISFHTLWIPSGQLAIRMGVAGHGEAFALVLAVWAALSPGLARLRRRARRPGPPPPVRRHPRHPDPGRCGSPGSRA